MVASRQSRRLQISPGGTAPSSCESPCSRDVASTSDRSAVFGISPVPDYSACGQHLWSCRAEPPLARTLEQFDAPAGTARTAASIMTGGSCLEQCKSCEKRLTRSKRRAVRMVHAEESGNQSSGFRKNHERGLAERRGIGLGISV